MENTLREFVDNEAVANLILKRFRVVKYTLHADSRSVGYWFEDSPALEQAWMEYLNGQSRVEPQDFYSQVRFLTSFRIYLQGGDPNGK